MTKTTNFRFSKTYCDICGQRRGVGDHRKCSRERQRRFATEQKRAET